MIDAFTMDDFLSGNIYVVMEETSQYEAFLDELHQQNIRWRSGERPKEYRPLWYTGKYLRYDKYTRGIHWTNATGKDLVAKADAYTTSSEQTFDDLDDILKDDSYEATGE